jgi:flavin-dependent dehydrogenase
VTRVAIAGGGPAGSAAALSALANGAAVDIYEKSSFPRHKVCGEFLSPEVELILHRLGARQAFQQAGPSRIRRVRLHFASREKQWSLTDPAFGLSRYAFDGLMLQQVAARGGCVRREAASGCQVAAYGRSQRATKGQRLFGFKAHFTGPVDDAVDLFFFNGCYAGVSAIEQERTNVCGLAPERLLHAHGFDIDAFLFTAPALRGRIAPLSRAMGWLVTGPLVFSSALPVAAGQYPAGDALGFIDPFTGSGISAALETGCLAGEAAARGIPVSGHLRQCRAALRRQYLASTLLRRAIESGIAERLVSLIPGRLLFQLTRPAPI